jgi:calcineurin-like phosphoesterase family protein
MTKVIRKLFTSDLHFKHNNICAYTDRSKVISQAEHDEWLIDLWNSQVNDWDDVYHLGDFCFSADIKRIESIIDQLNGNLHMIVGNHDKAYNFEKLKASGKIASTGHYKEITIVDTKVCLFHFPVAAWHRQHYGSWHLHGHCHGNYQGLGKSLDVGLDMSYNLFGRHKFFTEEDIAEFMQTREVQVADHHQLRKGD